MLTDDPWRLRFSDEVDPTGAASPLLIAHHFSRTRFLNGDQFTNRDVVEFCESNGINPFPVLLALRQIREGQRSYSVDNIDYKVVEQEWEARRWGGKTSCCPIPDWSMGSVAGRQDYKFHPCTSWRCPIHSRPKADALLSAAKVNFMAYPVIYHYVVEYNKTMVDRMRRKNARAGGCALLVALDNGKAHYFTTVRLRGRDTPTTRDGEALLPEEALECLASALKLPGVIRRSWSKGWPASEPRDDDHHPLGSDEDIGASGAEDIPKEPRIVLPSVQDSTHARALEIAGQWAQERWGVTPTEEWFPADVADPAEYAEMLKQAVVRVRNEDAWTRAETEYNVTESH